MPAHLKAARRRASDAQQVATPERTWRINMSVDEAGKWLAAAILEQPLFTKPVYQEKVRPPSSDGPLMVLTNVSKSRTRDVQNVDFGLNINPILLGEILDMFFDEDDQQANQIGAHCAATLDSVVSGSVEEVLHRCAHMPFNAALLVEIFPPPDPRSFRKEKPVAMRAIYDRLTRKGAG
ncbi:MAG TPA: hypothetical protein VGM32_13700 [Rhodopila sp.]